MQTLYYDCFAGISGDMNLGAMIDLGVDRNFLLDELHKLNLDTYELTIQKDQRRGIAGTRVDVLLTEHDHHARTFKDIIQLIETSGLSPAVRALSLDIFRRIATAEGKIHDRAVDDVHFHEIGAIDSIVDIVGAAICLDHLNVGKVLSSPVQVGGGFVTCAHGVLPVPAPATAELLRGIPIKSGLVPFETTTPTGAAILAATVHAFTENLHFTIDKVGYGIGHRDTEIPNVLRLFLGEMPEEERRTTDTETGDAVILECNIDDMNPEHYPYIMDLLFSKGAHDVFLTPIIMKKSRPAVKISVLCDLGRQKEMEAVLWHHSSSFGLRFHKVAKSMLTRKMITVKTAFGEISVKEGYFQGRKIKSKPEYEDCLRLAKEKGLSLTAIMNSIQGAERPEE